MKKVLIFVPIYLPGFKGGGPVRTISNLIDSIGDEFSFHVICMDRDLGDKAAYSSINLDSWNKQGKAYVLYSEPGFKGFLKIFSVLKRKQFDIIHLNNFFSFKFSILPIIISKILLLRTPIIIGPRGEFSEGALALKNIKKRIFIKTSKFFGLHRNVIWHASSIHEEKDIIKAIRPTSEIRIAIDIATNKQKLPLNFRTEGSPLNIVFISRISPMKNLLGAIEICSQVKVPINLEIYGPIEDQKYWEQCLDLSKKLPKNVKFSYKGELSPDEVSSCFSKYDLFLFPTHGENFGHVIAEALYSGVPILISNKTPWKDLSDKGVGWDLPIEYQGDFARHIEACYQISPIEYNKWRQKVQEWAHKNINSNDSIKDNKKLFTIN